jgi:hypothetical protein
MDLSYPLPLVSKRTLFWREIQKNEEDVDGRKGYKQMITKLCGFIGCIQCADAIIFKCIVARNIF